MLVISQAYRYPTPSSDASYSTANSTSKIQDDGFSRLWMKDHHPPTLTSAVNAPYSPIELAQKTPGTDQYCKHFAQSLESYFPDRSTAVRIQYGDKKYGEGPEGGDGQPYSGHWRYEPQPERAIGQGYKDSSENLLQQEAWGAQTHSYFIGDKNWNGRWTWQSRQRVSQDTEESSQGYVQPQLYTYSTPFPSTLIKAHGGMENLPLPLPPLTPSAFRQKFGISPAILTHLSHTATKLDDVDTSAQPSSDLDPSLNPQAAAFQPLAQIFDPSATQGSADYQEQPSRLVRKKKSRLLQSRINSLGGRINPVRDLKFNTIDNTSSRNTTLSNRRIASALKLQRANNQISLHGPPHTNDARKMRSEALVERNVAVDPLQSKPKIFAGKTRPYLQLLSKPQVSDVYIRNANVEPSMMTMPQQLLIILDLNGTLLHRSGSGGSLFKERPSCKAFLRYLLEHHKVLVWSSAKPTNVKAMCDKLFSKQEKAKLVGVWARDQLRLTPAQYNLRVQVYKQLSWVWNDRNVQMSHPKYQMGERWDQHNTVLIDDNLEKAAAEPWNLVKIEEFEALEDQQTTDVLGQVGMYLEWLRWHSNASSVIMRNPFQYFPDQQVDWTVLGQQL